MDRSVFTDRDLEQLREAGIAEGEALRQLRFFEDPPGYAPVLRPCTAGDGIRVLTAGDVEESIAAFERARLGNRFQKFVPASGAASRMFRALLRFLNDDRTWSREEIRKAAGDGDDDFVGLERFLAGISRFAFYGELAAIVSAEGADIETLAAKSDYRPILAVLLRPDRMDYGSLPKGQIPFHRYGDTSRTPFEEHLVEAALYAMNIDRTCRLHFTVFPEHEERFRAILAESGKRLEKEHGVRYDVTFSCQKRSTDTLSVDAENRLFRVAGDALLLRPGGHGTLIENLNDIAGDLVFIKNIDNVTPRQLLPEVFAWKKTLAGFLVTVQKEAFRLLDLLESDGAYESALGEAARFSNEAFAAPLPADAGTPEEKRAFLVDRLDRPVRVCGMVINRGDPGGGPFWVDEGKGRSSLQIVESAQIDPRSEEQQRLLATATHHNPVDMVCGVRDRHGEPYDLRRFIDGDAVFISSKSMGGRELKALERPGLWNGAMAEWNTIFVEVPPETFGPVKVLTDLLKEDHQAM